MIQKKEIDLSGQSKWQSLKQEQNKKKILKPSHFNIGVRTLHQFFSKNGKPI